MNKFESNYAPFKKVSVIFDQNRDRDLSIIEFDLISFFTDGIQVKNQRRRIDRKNIENRLNIRRRNVYIFIRCRKNVKKKALKRRRQFDVEKSTVPALILLQTFYIWRPLTRVRYI